MDYGSKQYEQQKLHTHRVMRTTPTVYGCQIHPRTTTTTEREQVLLLLLFSLLNQPNQHDTQYIGVYKKQKPKPKTKHCVFINTPKTSNVLTLFIPLAITIFFFFQRRERKKLKGKKPTTPPPPRKTSKILPKTKKKTATTLYDNHKSHVHTSPCCVLEHEKTKQGKEELDSFILEQPPKKIKSTHTPNRTIF